MSHDATKWAIQRRGLKPATKIVLRHLCDRHNPDFGCFPTQAGLAEDAEMSISPLNAHLARLEELRLTRGKWRTMEVLVCPITWRPHPEQIASAQRGYEDWWQALDWVRDGLVVGRKLRDVEVTAAMPKMRPWLTAVHKLVRLQSGHPAIDCNSPNQRLTFRLIAMQSMLAFNTQTGGIMASITIRNLDDDVKRRLRVRAAEHGRSMEEEARDILRQVVGQPSAPKNLGQAIHARFAALGGVDLPLTKRRPMRQTPDFD